VGDFVLNQIIRKRLYGPKPVQRRTFRHFREAKRLDAITRRLPGDLTVREANNLRRRAIALDGAGIVQNGREMGFIHMSQGNELAKQGLWLKFVDGEIAKMTERENFGKKIKK